MSFNYDKVLSTRNLRTEAGRLFLDLKCGDLMIQRVIRLETPRVFFTIWTYLNFLLHPIKLVF